VKTLRTLLAVAVAVLLVASSLEAADIAGTWVGKTDVPQQGPDEITLVLVKSASGAYTGTISDAVGTIAPCTPIAGVSWEKDVLTFSFKLADQTSVTLTARFEGGKLVGNWTHEQGATGAITLEKQKA
jgi:hypothetical protein